MEHIPNELLIEIGKNLDWETLKNLRMANMHWYTILMERFQQLAQVSFDNLSRIDAFLEAFGSQAESIPFRNFNFSSRVLWGHTTLSLERFCEKFRDIIRAYRLSAKRSHSISKSKSQGGSNEVEGPNYRCATVFCRNMKVILSNCPKLEQLTLVLSHYEMEDQLLDLPPLLALNSLVICYKPSTTITPDAELTHNTCLTDQILQSAPHLSSFGFSHGTPLKVLKVLKMVERNCPNSTVNIHKIHWPTFDTNHLTDLLSLPSAPSMVKELDLYVYQGYPHEQGDLTELLQRVCRWFELCKGHLRALKLAFDGNVEEMPLPDLPVLEYLNISGFTVTLQPVLGHVLQFPNLQTLVLHKGVKISGFSSCVLQNVKKAKIQLCKKQELEDWPKIIPNVVELEASGIWINAVFRLPNLVKLRFEFCAPVFEDVCDETPRYQWDFITASARPVPNAKITNLDYPLTSHMEDTDEEEVQFSFANLKRLTHLEFLNDNNDCWKAIIYAGRLGQLHRLQKLSFEFYHAMPKEYQDLLNDYHDDVRIAETEAKIADGLVDLDAEENDYSDEDYDEDSDEDSVEEGYGVADGIYDRDYD